MNSLPVRPCDYPSRPNFRGVELARSNRTGQSGILQLLLHRKDLPGSPDIVLPKYRTVIFVHDCFWHRHENCRLATTPKDNAEFWQTKFEQNIERDARNERLLREAGWNVVVIWQCETKKTALPHLEKRLRSLIVRRTDRISSEFYSLPHNTLTQDNKRKTR